MKLRTEILLQPSDWQIDHNSKILSFGSCFAERMTDRLLKFKFDCFCNPFGILFHPIPMIATLRAALESDHSVADSSFLEDGQYQNLAFHSKISHHDPDVLKEMIIGSLEKTGEGLKSADLLILTFGSSLGFRHLESNQIVGNCHRLPGNLFEMQQSRLSELKSPIVDFLNRLQKVNPKVKVLLTVSPVRHLRAGIVENAGSKAVLRALCAELEDDFAWVSYFPAWELLMDDLRDYRFYAQDLAHPSDLAEDYVWEKFADCWISDNSQKIIVELQQIFQSLQHRPRNSNGANHQKFLIQLRDKIERLRSQVNLDQELNQVEEQLDLD